MNGRKVRVLFAGAGGTCEGLRMVDPTADSLGGLPEVECPACGATIRARMSDAPPEAPGYDRIAEAIQDVLDSACLTVTIAEADGSEASLHRLARALDKHGLVDWDGFPPAGGPGGAPEPLADDHDLTANLLDANERMGEALVAIGMALGLPAPTAQHHWGRTEILAVIAELPPDRRTP